MEFAKPLLFTLSRAIIVKLLHAVVPQALMCFLLKSASADTQRMEGGNHEVFGAGSSPPSFFLGSVSPFTDK